MSVRDNGPGIPETMHDKIFEPFFTTRRGRGGTGLGLALCREYARRMGAELSFWSVSGRGACFRVSMALDDARPEGTPRYCGVIGTPASGGAIVSGMTHEDRSKSMNSSAFSWGDRLVASQPPGGGAWSLVDGSPATWRSLKTARPQ